VESLEHRRVLVGGSFIYGISDPAPTDVDPIPPGTGIFQILPEQPSYTTTALVDTHLDVTASNGLAYDQVADRMFFAYPGDTAGSGSGANAGLYWWNHKSGADSVIAKIDTSTTTTLVDFRWANASFYDGPNHDDPAYWFFDDQTDGNNADATGLNNDSKWLYKLSIAYDNLGVPTVTGQARWDLSATVPAAADTNIFGDIAINATTGVLYATTFSGAFYAYDVTAATPTLVGSSTIGGVSGVTSLQCAWNASYTTLYGHSYEDATWYTINTDFAGDAGKIVQVLNANSTPFTTPASFGGKGFRDLGGAALEPVTPANLSIAKSDTVTSVFAGSGQIYTYTITVSNDAAAGSAEKVKLTDTWPTAFTQIVGSFVTNPANLGKITQTPGSSDFTWEFDTLAPGATATLQVSYTVPFGTKAIAYTNTATVTALTDPETHTATDTNTVVSNALVAGTDLGCVSAPFVYVINPYAGTPAVVGQNVGVPNEVVARFNAYPELPGYRGGVRVAVGDVDGDNIPDVVTAPGPGALGRVKVFNLDGTPKAGFTQPYLPFGSSYRDGVEINVGDIDGDGDDDLVAAKSRGPGEVQVAKSSGTAFTSFKSFTAFGGTYRGGATAAIGSQLDANTVAIFVSSGPGMKPTVKYYTMNTNSGALSLVNQFNPVMPAGTAGVSLTTQRFVGGVLDTLVAAGRNGNSKVSAYNGGSNVNIANYSTFSAPAPKNNAPVYSAASSLADATGLVDTVFMAQGDGGVATIKKVNSTNGVVNPVFAPVYLGKPVASPLRIATNTRRTVIGR
jgi:uncharacterized repeat protein (TIGR01451 family)